MGKRNRKWRLSKHTAEQLRGPGLLLMCAVLFLAGTYLTREQTITVSNMQSQRELPVYCVQTDAPQVALSFDAAWGNEDTQELIDILDQYNAKATFFVWGPGWKNTPSQ